MPEAFVSVSFYCTNIQLSIFIRITGFILNLYLLSEEYLVSFVQYFQVFLVYFKTFQAINHSHNYKSHFFVCVGESDLTYVAQIGPQIMICSPSSSFFSFPFLHMHTLSLILFLLIILEVPIKNKSKGSQRSTSVIERHSFP